jgi:hypothetical protein
LWEKALTDSYYSSQKVKTPVIKPKPIKKAEPRIIKEIKPITSPKFQEISPKQTIPENQQEKQLSSRKIPQTSSQKATDQITEIKKKLQQKIKFAPKTIPNSVETIKTKDESGILIGIAFDKLVQKLHSIKGGEFSSELQKIADLVLERRGFSVTLHKLRSLINKFRFNDFLLNENDKNQILVNIETWKKKLT